MLYLTSGLQLRVLYYQIEHMKFAFTTEQFREAVYFYTGDTKPCLVKDLLAVDKKVSAE
ncbi:unnamed protein product [Albugo candida]|uniref:Uncharacterized protein n=1 Tax=Albugo candida TaxID=65357 RepID=A0A024FWM8_9STRA|nr:unnamed protein product [Albugo candida]|eukprot:CCI11337.1 unnamed protein product [Albugo candida]